MKLIRFVVLIIYIALLTLYLQSAQETVMLQAFEDIYISSRLILSLFVISLIVCFIFYRRSPYLKICKVFIAFCIIVIIISYIHTVFTPFSSNINYINIVLPLLFFIIFYRSKLFSSYWLTVISISLMSVWLLLNYCQAYNTLSTIISYKTGTSASYFLMYLLPLLLLLRNNWFQYISMAIIFILVASSFKRGGIISLTISIVVYSYIRNIILSRSNKFLGVLSIILVVLSISVLFVRYDSTNDSILTERLKNIEEDQGSGRIEIWKFTVDMIMSSTIDEVILGHGFNSVQNDSNLKMSAHNDFLEVLYDFGLLAFVFYIMLHFTLLAYIYRLIKRKSYYAPNMAMSYVLFLGASLVAHVIIYIPYLSIFAIVWGYIMRCSENEYSSQKYLG